MALGQLLGQLWTNVKPTLGWADFGSTLRLFVGWRCANFEPTFARLWADIGTTLIIGATFGRLWAIFVGQLLVDFGKDV